jgi:hypothetical protein
MMGEGEGKRWGGICFGEEKGRMGRPPGVVTHRCSSARWRQRLARGRRRGCRGGLEWPGGRGPSEVEVVGPSKRTGMKR